MKIAVLLLVSAWSLLAADPKTPAPKPTALDLQRASLKKQLDAIRQQLGVKIDPAAPANDFDFLLPPTLVPDIDCPPLDRDVTDSLIANAAKKHALDPQLVRAVMHQESAFKPCAVSIKGAQGLMQLMPATAARFHLADPFEPEQNVDAGTAYLKELIKKYNGDLRLALVAYNAGPLRADQLNPAQYPQETQAYLASIFAEIGKPKDDSTNP